MSLFTVVLDFIGQISGIFQIVSIVIEILQAFGVTV